MAASAAGQRVPGDAVCIIPLQPFTVFPLNRWPLSRAASGGGGCTTPIKASEKALISVFCDDYVFNIPSYQRPYAWTVEHAGQLLDDLVDCLSSAILASYPRIFSAASCSSSCPSNPWPMLSMDNSA